MMLVARMIIANPSAMRLYTQPIARPPTTRLMNWERLRAPIAPPGVERWWLAGSCGARRLVHPTTRFEWPERTGAPIVLTRPPIGPAFSHFGHHSGASILDSGTSGRGSMVGTAIRIGLRAAGAALPVLVLCAAPAAAQFGFPFSAPAPPPAPTAPNAAPGAGGRNQTC